MGNIIHSPIVVQLLCHVGLFATLWAVASQAPLFSIISWSLPKFISIETIMLLNYSAYYRDIKKESEK